MSARWTTRRRCRAPSSIGCSTWASWASRSPSATAAPAPASSMPCLPSRRFRASTRRSACSLTFRTHWSPTRCCAGDTNDLKDRYLPQLAKRAVGAYALSEAGSGSDAFALTTRAEDRAASSALTGRKLWITNANEADLFIVFATVNPDAGYKGHHRVRHRAGIRGILVSARRKTSSASAPAAPASCCSRIAVCRRATCSAKWAAATRSRSKRSTRAASASAPR